MTESLGNQIVFQWVRTHNLRNIDLELPKNKLITITGVSGSGKSSLAFDTIYKEGQFRYIESLSSYLRQFFNLGERPEIDYCSGLSPAIAIEQNKRVGNSRSSVGTLTEIDDYLRLLFAKLWDTYCYSCGKIIKPQTIDQIMKSIEDDYGNQKIYLLQESGMLETKEDLNEFVKKNRNKVEKGKWFTRYLLVAGKKAESPEAKTIGGEKGKKMPKQSSAGNLEPIEYFYLETPNVPEDYYPLNIFWIYDRVTVEEQKIGRLKEDIIKILGEAKKFWIYITETVKTSPKNRWKLKALPVEGWKWNRNSQLSTSEVSERSTLNTIRWFTDKMYCAECNVTYPEFTPQHFSPNRQEWACPVCHGIGEILQVDFDKILDPFSPYLKAIVPWRDSNLGQWLLTKLAQKYSIGMELLWKDLPERFQHVVLFGDEELIRISYGGKYLSMYYKGIEEIIKDQYAKWLLTVDFQVMLDMKVCPECNGARLKKESLNVFLSLHGKQKSWTKVNIADLQQKKLNDLVAFLDEFNANSGKDKLLTNRILNPLIDRAKTIQELWLGYLSLHRGMDTLSGWEIQRLRLAKQLWNKLTGIVYVLDEPTIWLDEREIKRAIIAIRKLQEMGNTIIVVEHNEEFIRASDRVVEIGPGAGDFWGKVMFNGPYEEFLKSDCLTAQYLMGKKKVKINFEHKPSNKYVTIRKAAKYNLQSIDVKIRLWSFTIITWPSGAGKTTLMYTTLFRFLQEKEKFIQSYIRLQLLKKGWTRQDILAAPVMQKQEYDSLKNIALQEFYKDLAIDTIQGHDDIKNVIYVDQTSIGKTPRSCPATFIWTFDHIRNLFAGTSESKYLWFSSSFFSFNSKKWSCPACDGYGYKKVELQFLPDTYIPCDLCHGLRYKPEILAIKWRGKTITEILDMYISDALELFSEIDHIKEDLQLMCDIWLWYLRMGQPAHTLSGWESQRLKLVKHLLKSYKWHTMYFLDEPTVGLHFEDIEKLLRVMKEFLDKWDTILMIEHDQNILQFADEIIRLEDWKIV